MGSARPAQGFEPEPAHHYSLLQSTIVMPATVAGHMAVGFDLLLKALEKRCVAGGVPLCALAARLVVLRAGSFK